MKYKTRIEIISEAQDKNEALDIAGEYLSGNMNSGVDMKFSVKPVNGNGIITGIAVISSILVVAGLFALISMNTATSHRSYVSGVNAFQPQLVTSKSDGSGIDFRKNWETRQINEALNFIKQSK